MALYDGEAGPYEVDWYWQARSGAEVPSDAHILFDRAGLPQSGWPNEFNHSETPPALREAQGAMSPAARQADEGRNTVSLFWAMLLISASHIARGPSGEDVPFLPMLQDLLGDMQQFISLPPRPPRRRARGWPSCARWARGWKRSCRSWRRKGWTCQRQSRRKRTAI